MVGFMLGGVPLKNFNYVAIDLETTGLDDQAEIIEIALVKVENNVIKEEWQQLICPSSDIPEDIQILTGISNEMVIDKPLWKDVEEKVLSFLGNNLLVAHNASFDKRILENNLGKDIENIWLDTCELAKITLPTLSSYKLKSLLEFFDLDSQELHRALKDAQMTTRLLENLIEILLKFSPFLLEENIKLLEDEKNGLSFILKYVQKNILNNYFENDAIVKTVSSEDSQENEGIGYSLEKGSDLLKPGGPISENFTDFQYRPQQIAMLENIIKAFQGEKHGLIEAGTGTGKSLAYLIPATLWSKEKKEKVVIATHTIALQEQLFTKDIPFLEEKLRGNISKALVKGRSNYLCLRRFESLKREHNTLNWWEKVFLAQITNWALDTQSGDKEELNLKNWENEMWLQIASQGEACLGSRCPYYFKDCFYTKNKKIREKSDLIITNHALLLQDLKSNNKILPPYQQVIIDEGHNLEDEATEQFSTYIDLRQILKLFYRLHRKKYGGFLDRLNKNIDNQEKLKNLIIQIKEEILFLSNKIRNLLESNVVGEYLGFNDEKRITDKERKSSKWLIISEELQEINNYLQAINKKITKLFLDLDLDEELNDFQKELKVYKSDLEEVYEGLNNFLNYDNNEFVYFINKTNKNIRFCISPIEVSSLLNELLFVEKKSVILTSATLTSNNNFNYIAKILGLNEFDYLTFKGNSPFNYNKQSRIFIINDLLNPVNNSNEIYTQEVIKCLKKILPLVYGGTLILFTSYRMLNDVYWALKKEELQDKEIFAHGIDGTRNSLVKIMKNKKNTIILGVNSFWEGIDIKGDALTNLIIVKLPFIPPTRPVIQARLEKIEEKGQNSFYNYSLPRAVLKFRQGYGRLIRSNSDCGSCIILDNRVVTKRYGKQFLMSLPKQPIFIDSLEDTSINLKNFF